jgi:formamidopyrimidine-DNA glycosylase
MPELPEIETIKRGLETIKNNKIHFRLNNLLNPISRMEQVLNKIEKFNRNFHEKY